VVVVIRRVREQLSWLIAGGSCGIGCAQARERGIDTVKIAVMHGNAPAPASYEARGYPVAEHVLYRRLGDR
jgi:hypothetical protein